MAQLKFSFLVPVYNEEARIGQCLKSIVNQDYPRQLIEILVVDGGSSDRTKEIASGFACVKVLENPRKLADFGAKIAAKAASGDLFVIFAADNGLAGEDWLKVVAELFGKDPGLAACWGRMVPSKEDNSMNRYYTLIQNDPLSFFVNKNLNRYLTGAARGIVEGKLVYNFEAEPRKPLIWGANGLVYRGSFVKDIILQDGFIADNDVFQTMLERGNRRVAYSPDLGIYHHHVGKISDWVKKWKRNYISHFLNKRQERNLGWAFDKYFGLKLLAWMVYSAIPVFSIAHSIYLSIRDSSLCWMFHPLVSFMQLYTYTTVTVGTKEGRRFIWEKIGCVK